jgi:hypothetical protein
MPDRHQAATARASLDQTEEQARFVVMQRVNAGAIDHRTVLQMRDSLRSWRAIVDWIDAKVSGRQEVRE